MAGRQITVDRELCIGSGVCVSYAMATFANDDEGKAVVIDPNGDNDEIVQAAIEGCPTGALKLRPAEGEGS